MDRYTGLFIDADSTGIHFPGTFCVSRGLSGEVTTFQRTEPGFTMLIQRTFPDPLSDDFLVHGTMTTGSFFESRIHAFATIQSITHIIFSAELLLLGILGCKHVLLPEAISMIWPLVEAKYAGSGIPLEGDRYRVVDTDVIVQVNDSRVRDILGPLISNDEFVPFSLAVSRIMDLLIYSYKTKE